MRIQNDVVETVGWHETSPIRWILESVVNDFGDIAIVPNIAVTIIVELCRKRSESDSQMFRDPGPDSRLTVLNISEPSKPAGSFMGSMALTTPPYWGCENSSANLMMILFERATLEVWVNHSTGPRKPELSNPFWLPGCPCTSMRTQIPWLAAH